MARTLLSKLSLVALCTCVSSVFAAPQPITERAVTASSKAGLGWSASFEGDSVNIGQFSSKKVSWYYSWSPDPTSTSLEFVPMLWGNVQLSDWKANIQSVIKNNKVTAALGPNEPDNSGQSALTPAQAVSLWKANIQPLHSQGIRLGAPAVSSASTGQPWLSKFISACTGCTIDFIPIHYYGTDANAFITYVKNMHTTFNKPIWVTEWACENFGGGAQCSQADVNNFLKTTQAFLDSSSFVERYAWFGAMTKLGNVNEDNALENPQGVITALGHQYIGA